MASLILNGFKAIFGKDEPVAAPQIVPEKKETVNLGQLDSPAFRSFLLGTNWELLPENLTFPVVAQTAFERNLVVYKCVMMIANAVGSLHYKLYNDTTGEEIKTHPLLDLIKYPNPKQAKHSFFSEAMADYLLDGNTFIEMVSVGNGQAPGRLWLQRPDMVQIIVGNSRLPQAFVYTPGGVETGNSKTYPVDPLTGKCDLLHIYSYAPLSENMDGRGLSPVRSAWMSVLTHNDSVKWNHALIKNGARPSGVLQSEETLAQDQVEYLMHQIKGMFAGGANAGKVPVLGGGLTWQELSLNPTELGYLQGKDSVARDIAIAMGMPPMLLNLPGDNTFSNYAQAKQSFYEDTVIPHAKHLLEELNRWLVPRFGKNMCLKIDEDAIPALAPQRALQWDAIMNSTIHTINEKRAILGFEPIENGDEVLVPSNMLPLTAAIVVDELPTTGQGTQDPTNNPGDDEEDDLPDGGSSNAS